MQFTVIVAQRYGCTTTKLRPYYDYATAVLRLCYGHTTATLRPYYGYATAVLRLRYGRTTTTLRKLFFGVYRTYEGLGVETLGGF